MSDAAMSWSLLSWLFGHTDDTPRARAANPSLQASKPIADHTPSERTNPTAPTSAHTVRDTALIARISSADESDARAAFDTLFAAYVDPLTVWARHLVGSDTIAADLVADIFVGLWTRRARLSIHGSIQSYLYSAVRLRAVDHLRHQRVVRDLERTPDPFLNSEPARADAATLEHELTNAVRDAVASLPARSRMVITLRWTHGLSTADVAATLGISVKTVENHTTIAFRHLRSRLARFQ